MSDEVTVAGTTIVVPADPANPTSNSPQCFSTGVTLTATGIPPAGETWYWQTSATGTSTTNSGSTFTVTSSGTYYIRSQDNTTLAWSNGAGSIAITITPNVSAPYLLWEQHLSVAEVQEQLPIQQLQAIQPE